MQLVVLEDDSAGRRELVTFSNAYSPGGRQPGREDLSAQLTERFTDLLW